MERASGRRGRWKTGGRGNIAGSLAGNQWARRNGYSSGYRRIGFGNRLECHRQPGSGVTRRLRFEKPGGWLSRNSCRRGVRPPARFHYRSRRRSPLWLCHFGPARANMGSGGLGGFGKLGHPVANEQRNRLGEIHRPQLRPAPATLLPRGCALTRIRAHWNRVL